MGLAYSQEICKESDEKSFKIGNGDF